MVTCPHCGSTPATTLIFGVHVPVKLESEANSHQHYWNRVARAQAQRQAWAWVSKTISEAGKIDILDALKSGVLLVNIVRVERGRLDSDNLAGCAKHLRDSIAIWLGINDADPSVRWLVTQERPGIPGARVEFRRLER